MVLGTPAFLAPELVAGQGSFDGRADIYSLGCVAFWLLTGRPPFEADDAMSLLMQHSNDHAAAAIEGLRGARSRRTWTRSSLECLSKDPAHRPGSAEVLWQRLDTLSVAGRWDQRRARAWWELHEPELVGRG